MENVYNILSVLELADKIVSILEGQRTEIEEVVKRYHSSDVIRGIKVGDSDVIGQYPSITVGIPRIGIVPIGAHYSMDINLTGNVSVRIKEVQVDWLFRYEFELAARVLAILLQPKYNRIELDSGTVYDFDVFGDTIFGAEKAGAIRVAKIPFSARQFRSGFKGNNEPRE